MESSLNFASSLQASGVNKEGVCVCVSVCVCDREREMATSQSVCAGDGNFVSLDQQ